MIQASGALELCDDVVARLDMKLSRGCGVKATRACVCVKNAWDRASCDYHIKVCVLFDLMVSLSLSLFFSLFISHWRVCVPVAKIRRKQM